MSEFLDIARAASKALSLGETVCLATVVRVRGSAPRHSGARLLVWPDGKFHGTIGGGTLEWRVMEDARAALAEGQPQFKNYVFDPRGGPDSVGLCGGSVDVHMDILRPDPTLLIIGAGHIAQPLAQMASLLDLRAVVVDDRSEWANRDRFPTVADVIVVDYDPITETLAPIPIPMTPSTYVVITTWGYDLPALDQAIAQNPAYIGLVASPTKARELFKRMIAKGVSPEALQRVNTPAGLDIGSETPAEVALAILAEVLAVQRGSRGGFLQEARAKQIESLLIRETAAREGLAT